MSRFVIRPLIPVPLPASVFRSTLFSRAIRRTRGDERNSPRSIVACGCGGGGGGVAGRGGGGGAAAGFGSTAFGCSLGAGVRSGGGAVVAAGAAGSAGFAS